MPDSPIALVTCGPAHEPIDSVRRITNVSSGELGVYLCEALKASGFAVQCLRGEMATNPMPPNVEAQSFSTNDSLAKIFQHIQRPPSVIFHAAALCDYLVAEVEGVKRTQKIRSDAAELRLTLRPAAKLLPQLPLWFPDAVIVGWKYELDGTREEALARGRAQIVSAGTSACVVNGAAYGEGFGFIVPEGGEPLHFGNKKDLSAFLGVWALRQVKER
jgi:phosphopantothenate---cysteine ligase (CTP)